MRFLKKTALGSLLLMMIFAVGHAYGASDESQNHFTGLIVSWEQKQNSSDTLWLRTHEVKNDSWTEWYGLETDEDIDEAEFSAAEKSSNKQGFISHETLFSTNLSDSFEYVFDEHEGAPDIKNVRIETLNSKNPRKPLLTASLYIPKKPHIISRSEWGANETITQEERKNGSDLADSDEQSPIEEADPEIEKIITHDAEGKKYEWPLQYAQQIKFIVIHHTASVKNLDAPATAIQNIEYYHAVKRGWGDIGYNYLIDTQGNIYEGRKGGEKIIGGHARPLNKVSIGIAVLGNYQNEEIPAPVLTSLMALIKEKARLHKLDITAAREYKGKTYNTVQGHSDNSPTVCPGMFLKEKLGDMKNLITYTTTTQPSGEPGARFSLKDHERRPIMVTGPGKEKIFTIRLKNTGTAAWQKGTFIEQTGTQVKNIPKILARLEQSNVDPGDIGIFKGRIPPLLISGLKVPEAQLVANGSVRIAQTFPVPLFVEGVKNSYEIAGRNDPPAVMKAGKRYRAWITLKNTGNFTWKRGGTTRVSLGTARPIDSKSPFFKGKNRIASLAEKEVKPGELGRFVFHIQAPKTAGTYEQYFQPVIETISWMPDLGMHFTATVESAEKPLRVAITFNKKTVQLQSTHGMTRYEQDEMVKEFLPGETAAVESPLPNNKIYRFVPKNSGIITVSNMEKRPAWNPALNDNMFRGILEIRTIDGELTLINELPLEDYLKGVGEVSNGDPQEKIKTIIILARSYARYYRDVGRKFPGKPYDLDDDPDHTQKYLGYGFELRSPQVTQAVTQTAGTILTYGGKQILTPYFNQSDGRTRSAKEVWGWQDTPYLQSVSDTFCKTTQLKGHGVGLSGCGATELAKQGKTAEEIINYYYQGVELTDKK